MLGLAIERCASGKTPKIASGEWLNFVKISGVHSVKITSLLKAKRIRDERITRQGTFRCQVSKMRSCPAILCDWQILISVHLMLKTWVSLAWAMDAGMARMWVDDTAQKLQKVKSVLRLIDAAFSFTLQCLEKHDQCLIVGIKPYPGTPDS